MVIGFFIGATVILWAGMLYGDYLDGEFKPFWQKKKKDVNSGAKFG
jgi:hypothetical protein